MTSVKRSYKVGLRFDEETPHKARDVEKQANTIVRRYQEIVQNKIVNQNMVDHAYELLDEDPSLSGTHGARHLAKKVGDGSNIGQVSTTYVISAVNGAIDRERKLSHLFDLFKKYPKEAVSWMVFHRTPFLEATLGNRLDVNFEYARNLVFSAGRNMTSAYADVILPELSEADFKQALDAKLNQIASKIEELRDEGIDTSKIKGFYNKLVFLDTHREILSLCLYHWLQQVRASKRGLSNNNNLPSRWKSLKMLSTNFQPMVGITSKYKHLFSAIRSVAVHALSASLIETVKNLCETVSERDLVAKPFRKTRQALAPVNLIMGSKYVITRPGSGKVLTELAKKDKAFSLGIKDPDRRGRTIEAKVIIHDRLHRMLERGARITSLSIRSGEASAHKIIVIIHLKGEPTAFVTTKFLQNYPDLNLTQTDTVGLDINRVGPHMMAFSEQIELPETLTTICDRYIRLEDEISKLSEIVSKTRSVKHKGELNRVYKRRANLLDEIRNQCKMLTTAVLVQSEANQLNVEKLELTARGKRGALAKAILNMPDNLDIFEQAVFLAATATGSEIDLKPINPYRTSSVHYNCRGKLLRGATTWDEAVCGKCGTDVNTHYNAALNIKAGGVAG